jgi:hypothetical protein
MTAEPNVPRTSNRAAFRSNQLLCDRLFVRFLG